MGKKTIRVIPKNPHMPHPSSTLSWTSTTDSNPNMTRNMIFFFSWIRISWNNSMCAYMLICIWTGIVSQQYSAIVACLMQKEKKKTLTFLPTRVSRLKYLRAHSVWLKTQRTGKPQKQYTVQSVICILKTGKIWYGFGTVPSGIINTFQPLLCSSHIMLWQASTPPARPLILTQPTPTHQMQTWTFILASYIRKHKFAVLIVLFATSENAMLLCNSIALDSLFKSIKWVLCPYLRFLSTEGLLHKTMRDAEGGNPSPSLEDTQPN